jgi:hypothetical protein
MPFIPRQLKPPARVAVACKVPETLATLLKRYAEFLESTQEYVVVETLRLAFRRDKEFQTWLATTHPEVPTTDLDTVRARRSLDRRTGSAYSARLPAPADPGASGSGTTMSFEVICRYPPHRPSAARSGDHRGDGQWLDGFLSSATGNSKSSRSVVREQNLRVAVRNLARALGDDISRSTRCSTRACPMGRGSPPRCPRQPRRHHLDHPQVSDLALYRRGARADRHSLRPSSTPCGRRRGA